VALCIGDKYFECCVQAHLVDAEDLEGPAYQTCMNAAANEAALWDRPMPRREPPERRGPMTAARLFEVPEPLV
jgi:hypothetical protein